MLGKSISRFKQNEADAYYEARVKRKERRCAAGPARSGTVTQQKNAETVAEVNSKFLNLISHSGAEDGPPSEQVEFW